MPPPTTRRHPPTAAALALVLALATVAAAGCAHSHQQLGPTAKVTAPSSGPTPESSSPTVEQQVAAAYVEAKATFYRNALSPNPDDPRLIATRSGPELALVVQLLRKARSDRIEDRLRAGRQPKVDVETVSLTGSSLANLQACITDDVIRVQTPGERIIDDSVASYRVRAQMRLESGRWKLINQWRLKKWNDTLGCAR